MKYGQHYYSVITAEMRAYVLFLIMNRDVCVES